MSIEGVDYSFARPSPAALKAAGKKFAVRYGGPGSDGKHLHADELAALRANGIDVVANAEGTAGGYTSTAAGRSWASTAEADFRALGMPAGRPIYFSVDFNAGPADWAGVDAALRGSAAVIGADRVGVYGSYDTILHCMAAGTARWFWQTYAWSGGKQHPGVHLFQYRNGVTIGGGDCDLTRALTDDYGQWGYQGEIDMPLDSADKAWLLGSTFTAAIVKAVMAYKIDTGSALNPNRTLATFAQDVQNLRDAFAHELSDTRVKNRPLPGSGLDKLLSSADALTAGLAAARAENAARDAATAALVQKLLDLVVAGGGDLDTAALVAKLDEVKQELADAARTAGDAARSDVLAALKRSAQAGAASFEAPAARDES